MLMAVLSKRWAQLTILLILLGVGISLILPEKPPSFIARLQQFNYDTYNVHMPRDPAGRYRDVAIVDIDEESLRRVGQWPWPRPLMGDLALALRDLGAKSVAFDMTFSEPDRLSPERMADTLPNSPDMAPVAEVLKKMPTNDSVFAQKIGQAGNVITGFVTETTPTKSIFVSRAPFCGHSKPPFNDKHPAPPLLRARYLVTSLPEITRAAAGNGIFTAEPDEQDGIIRHVPLLLDYGENGGPVTDVLPALSLEALRVSLRDEFQILEKMGRCAGYDIDESDIGTVNGITLAKKLVPTDSWGKINVYYHGYYSHPEHYNDIYVPAWQVLEKKAPADKIKGKIVLVGTSSIGLLDLRSSPLTAVLPGVEIHAEIIEQLLHDQYLIVHPDTKYYELLFIIAVCLGVIFLTPVISGGTMALLVAVILAAEIGGGVLAYQSGYLIDVAYPSFVIIVIFIMSSILTNLRTEMEKRMIRQAFDRYLSPALIEELVKDPSRLKLGGDVRELSVMFTDIRNFTTISESMDPAELIRMMNDFLTPMTSAVLDNKGFVDKYMGDAMMTFWNAPVDDPYHATNACRAALEMVEALKPVNAELRARAEKAGKPFHELKAGIGINSGKASVGNMGSKQRFAYSALGDTVNLASRMEGQTKVYGVTTMISASTQALVKDFACIELDLLTVKGRAEPERVYTLLGDEKLAATPAFKAFAEAHARMLAAYRAQDWDAAGKLITECASLRPDLAALYHLYAERIGAYRAHPPGPEWTGVWIAKEK